MIGFLAGKQAQLAPSPEEVVSATVTSAEITGQLREGGYLAGRWTTTS